VSTAITIDSTYAEPFFAKSGILNRLMCMRRKWAELALKSVCAAPDKGRGEGSYRRVMRPITSSAPELSNSIAVYTHKSISRDSTISEADIQKRHIPPRKMNATPQTLTWRQLGADPDEDAVCTIYRPSGWVQLYPILRREIVHHHSLDAESNIAGANRPDIDLSIAALEAGMQNTKCDGPRFRCARIQATTQRNCI
jgi:hypothetical protein